ncbi:uncharacterized protein LOC124133068 [Haliotis rufescens]|uniref:uncharacterized protein LOC124133068 n=1 Tax=Haliotis rufescens TaxID=6454 RepID=UPI001EB0A11D|nr:uncharacterized protein LOC124133068 [Haliotis rufescens]
MDATTWFTCLIAVITGALSQQASESTNECPKDIIKQAMGCFSDLASGVTKGQPAQFARSMPLDYHMIREYCQEGGHMTRFLSCIDNLQRQCENAQEAEVLLQIINPERVRTSVPNLCGNIDLIEGSAECLNQEMTRDSSCKNSAKEMIKKGMAETPRNVSALFIVQCRFFNILAECQRTSVKKNCGEQQANLHADFILSFVPNTCSNTNSSMTSTGDVTTNKPLRTSEETATLLGVSPFQKHSPSYTATVKSSVDTTHKPKDKAPELSGNKIPEQILKTLPPFLKDDEKLGLKVGPKSRRHSEDATEDVKTTNAGESVAVCSGLVVSLVACLLLIKQ